MTEDAHKDDKNREDCSNPIVERVPSLSCPSANRAHRTVPSIYVDPTPSVVVSHANPSRGLAFQQTSTTRDLPGDSSGLISTENPSPTYAQDTHEHQTFPMAKENLPTGSSQKSGSAQLSAEEVGNTVEKCRHYGWKKAVMDIQKLFDKSNIEDIRMDVKLSDATAGINDKIRLNKDEFIAARIMPNDMHFPGDWRTGYNRAIEQVNNYLKYHRNIDAKNTWGKSGGEKGKVEGIREGLRIMFEATGPQEYYFQLRDWFSSAELEVLKEKREQLMDVAFIPGLEYELGGDGNIGALGKTSGSSNRLSLVGYIVKLIEVRENLAEKHRITKEEKNSGGQKKTFG